ncbi:MAG: twin-arginine translocase subunit TatC [Candidatus Curtissbacteria bacterium]|nr:twin-arginine translocase subunit TatC [Candidatus Curtissbacteria bacterium]
MENITPLNYPQLKAELEKYQPFLLEARKRLIFTLCVFATATIAGFVFYEKIIKFLIRILNLEGINVVFTSPFQFITLAISCGLATGLVISFPLFVIQILYFLKPALRKKEFKIVTRHLPLFFILFLAGFVFGTLIMKWQIQIFLEKSVSLGIGNVLDISRLLTTVLLTSVLLGIAFEFPLVLLILLRTGIINGQQLKRSRRWVYLGSFLFAILLPADSILADVFLALPLIILFEITLLLNRLRK